MGILTHIQVRGGAHKTNERGNRLSTAIDSSHMIPMNDSTPTHLSHADQANNNLDLIFVNAGLTPFCTAEVIPDSYTSDHLPVICEISIGFTLVESSNTRLNTRKVHWNKFREELETQIFEEKNMGLTRPDSEYSRLIGKIKTTLMECGAKALGVNKGKRKAQPLWWNEECGRLIAGRREALKKYLSTQRVNNLMEYKRISNKIKRELRKIKANSSKEFC